MTATIKGIMVTGTPDEVLYLINNTNKTECLSTIDVGLKAFDFVNKLKNGEYNDGTLSQEQIDNMLDALYKADK